MNAINRRSLLLAGLGAAGTGILAACAHSSTTQSPALVSPSGAAVADTDRKRRHGGAERHVKLTATAEVVDLGGKTVNTWSFAGALPGQEIRMTAKDTLVAKLANHLPAPTAVHWHGLALRNDMDGVPSITQRAVPPGGGFTYRFVADAPGTYWYHSHVGVQRDRGLYGPLIIEDPRKPLAYDDEWVVVPDDWLDGVTGTPDQVLAELQQGMGKAMGMSSPSASGMGGDGMGGSRTGAAPTACARQRAGRRWLRRQADMRGRRCRNTPPRGAWAAAG
jgi:multicopper oxidase